MEIDHLKVQISDLNENVDRKERRKDMSLRENERLKNENRNSSRKSKVFLKNALLSSTAFNKTLN